MRMVLASTVNRANPTDNMISGLWLHKASWRVLDGVLNNKFIYRDLMMIFPHRELKVVN